MKLCRTTSSKPDFAGKSGCVVTIGAFDGIHRGHQAILQRLKRESEKLDCPAYVMCFEPTPGEFFSNENPPARLTRFRERFQTLASLGIDGMFCPRFDDAMRALSPEEFVSKLLVDKLAAKHVVVGDDFKFAARAAGTIDYLRKAGERFGFGVTEVPAIQQGAERVSSTAIRRALVDGDMRKVSAMLGRDYSMSGHVVYGNQLGRTLGFPTANIPVMRMSSPVQGIFAVRVHGLREGVLDAVANVGTRPTVTGSGKTILEVFIFDFDRDIYGKFLEVKFIARLRDELKFPDLESMTVQIHRDADQARELLENTH